MFVLGVIVDDCNFEDIGFIELALGLRELMLIDRVFFVVAQPIVIVQNKKIIYFLMLLLIIIFV